MKALKADYSKDAYHKAQSAVKQERRTESKKGKKRDRSRTRSPPASDSEDDVVVLEKAKAQGAKEAELSFKRSKERLGRLMAEVKGACVRLPASIQTVGV